MASYATVNNDMHVPARNLEVFRKKLMQSLQEDEENPGGSPAIVAKPTLSDEESSLPPSRNPSVHSQAPIAGNVTSEDHEFEVPKSSSVFRASQTTTPRLTPPGSPPSLSGSTSPTRRSRPLSPRRHSVSFSTTRGMFDDRSSFSTSDARSHTGRTRVDGKEFFRQVRSRLSYEQFGSFLSNVKELNSHKQSREETLRKAEEIFGTEHKDLYLIFEGLITRNVH